MLQEVDISKVDSFRILRDRIFIADELRCEGILNKWDTAVTNYEMHNSDERVFAERFSTINDQLVRMALNPPKQTGWFKLWRLNRKLVKLTKEKP